MTQKQPAPTARMKLTFHDSDVTNYFFLYIYFTCSCFLFTNIYTQMNCNIIIRHSDNSLCSYYLCFSCKNQIYYKSFGGSYTKWNTCTKKLKIKANEQSLYCKMCAKISSH